MAKKSKQEQQHIKHNKNKQNNKHGKGMQNYTFDCGDLNFASKFSMSLEEIENYDNRTQYYASLDINALVWSMDVLEFVILETDKEVQNIGVLQQKIWFDSYMVARKRHDTLTENVKKELSICITLC